jgi:hypothetical protein
VAAFNRNRWPQSSEYAKEIQNDEIYLDGAGNLQGGLSLLRFRYLIAILLQQGAQHRSDLGLVVYNEYVAHSAFQSLAFGAPGQVAKKQ